MVKKRNGWPNWAYYLAAILISALTIPMYRYMFAHASDARAQPLYSQSAQTSFYDVAPQSSPEVKPVRKRLLAGELCEAGYVILKNGNSYTQGMDAAGHPSRCADGYLIESP